MHNSENGLLLGRELAFFHHTSGAEYGYQTTQNDTFAILHPKNEKTGTLYPLYVVFHSAGHDVYSAVACTWQEGNHDIYHVPEDMYGLFLDCRANGNIDWWWAVSTRRERAIRRDVVPRFNRLKNAVSIRSGTCSQTIRSIGTAYIVRATPWVAAGCSASD